MTITRNYAERSANDVIYFREQYAEKPLFIWFWRYGYKISGKTVIIKDMLSTRPNIKRF